MRILVALDAFKDGCTSLEACEAVREGIHKVKPSAIVEICPISDGGEGTVDILQYHLGGKMESVTVSNPLFKSISAHYLKLDSRTAYIEMAQASGLELLSEIERNPLNTSTFGTGELILDAISKGCDRIIIAVGGSATNDLGMGLGSAMGYQYLDSSGNLLSPIGYNLNKVSKIDQSNIDSRIRYVAFSVITDVSSPLFGPEGAAFTFAKQKGANPASIIQLDKGLHHLSEVIKSDLGKDIADVPGSGAAGGLGGGCVAFLDADIRSGFDAISQLIHLKEKINQADIVITGEGSIDHQTKHGKCISGICNLSKTSDKKVIVFCGKSSLNVDDALALGIDQVIPVSNPNLELQTALSQTIPNLIAKAENWTTSKP